MTQIPQTPILQAQPETPGQAETPERTDPATTRRPRNTWLCVVAYQPDPIRQEQVNIAVLLEVLAPGTPFLGARIRPDAVPVVLGLDPNLHRWLLKGWLEGLMALQDIPQREQHASRLEAFYQQHQSYMRGPYRVLKPTPMFDVPDPETRLELFYQTMVRTPEAVLSSRPPEHTQAQTDLPSLNPLETFLRQYRKLSPAPYRAAQQTSEKS